MHGARVADMNKGLSRERKVTFSFGRTRVPASQRARRVRLWTFIDLCITQLKAQGPSRTCNESKEEEQEEVSGHSAGCSLGINPAQA